MYSNYLYIKCSNSLFTHNIEKMQRCIRCTIICYLKLYNVCIQTLTKSGGEVSKRHSQIANTSLARMHIFQQNNTLILSYAVLDE